MEDKGEYITEKEASEMLGVSSRFLANRRCRRQPPEFVRLGRIVRYSRRAIRKFMDEQTVRAVDTGGRE